MAENRVWERLKESYFETWTTCDPDDWPSLALKMEMIDELKAEMRKIANSGDMDNARSTGAE